MSVPSDGPSVLNRLIDEGRISEEELEELRRHLSSTPDAESADRARGREDLGPHSEDDSAEEASLGEVEQSDNEPFDVYETEFDPQPLDRAPEAVPIQEDESLGRETFDQAEEVDLGDQEQLEAVGLDHFELAEQEPIPGTADLFQSAQADLSFGEESFDTADDVETPAARFPYEDVETPFDEFPADEAEQSAGQLSYGEVDTAAQFPVVEVEPSAGQFLAQEAETPADELQAEDEGEIPVQDFDQVQIPGEEVDADHVLGEAIDDESIGDVVDIPLSEEQPRDALEWPTVDHDADMSDGIPTDSAVSEAPIPSSVRSIVEDSTPEPTAEPSHEEEDDSLGFAGRHSPEEVDQADSETEAGDATPSGRLQSIIESWLVTEWPPPPVLSGALGAAAVLLLFGSAFGLFPWVAWLIAVLTLVVVMVKGARMVVLGGFALTALVAFIGAWPQAPVKAEETNTVAQTPVTQPAATAPADSLDVTLSDLTDKWNELDQGPFISGGLLRNPEVGRFDSFTYRFDSSSLIAGAYDPDNDYLYALLVSARLGDPNAGQMNLHLCYILHPFSQDCIDSYFVNGLGGKELDFYVDGAQEAEWRLGDERWRLTIEDNVQTIRVLSPEAG